ncbi:MAG TPA: ATP-binding protein [Polyangiaceae bacterium]|nr:ATP-binding protein [Polyangiaceae bacterium]
MTLRPGAPWLGAFDQSDREVRLRQSKIAHALIIVIHPAGASLDWLVYPEHVLEFFALRLGAAALAGVALLCHYTSFARAHVRWLAMVAPVLVNLTIAVMVYRSEGAASPYYAGLNVVLAGIGVLLPWTLAECALACGISVFAYVLACVGHGSLDSGRHLFLSNLYFLVVTAIICTTAAEFKHRGRVEEFRLSAELARSYQQVSELERLKTEFFANVSHELRTPLTLILSPLGDIDERLNELPSDIQELVEIARTNSLRLLRLVNDLLQVSRLESGEFVLHPEPLELGEFAAAQVESVRALARLKGLELWMQAPRDKLWINADPAQLEKILMNLLTNAIKFTPRGGRVSLAVRAEGERAVVKVTDTGIGIAESDVSLIFERFRQADGSNERRYSGVGIGLSLARELAEKHGGSLVVASRVGEGSTFTLSVPARAAGPIELDSSSTGLSPAHALPDDTLTRLVREADRFTTVVSDDTTPEPTELDAGDTRATVLVIDDEPDMRRYLAGILRDQFRVLRARDGRQGLALYRKERPELVVVDLMMPGMNGWELCAALKREPGGSPKILVVTARTDEMAKIAALKQGADDFLSKPFSTLEVRTRLTNLALSQELERNLRLQNTELKETLEKLRAAEAMLVAREKMDAVVRLAGGILHEINNPLNFTLTAISVALDRTEGQGTVRSILEDVEAGMLRVRDIVADLRTFATPGAADTHQPLILKDVVEQALRFTALELKDVNVRCDIPDGFRIRGSKSQILQVFTNLLLNAGNAVRTISHERMPTIEIRAKGGRGGASVVVRDNGTGIPEELLGKVFDPFLTTRDVGKGMGLGLSICRAVVAAHGGDIRVRSQAGSYTEVEFDLPQPETGVAA